MQIINVQNIDIKTSLKKHRGHEKMKPFHGGKEGCYDGGKKGVCEWRKW